MEVKQVWLQTGSRSVLWKIVLKNGLMVAAYAVSKP